MVDGAFQRVLDSVKRSVSECVKESKCEREIREGVRQSEKGIADRQIEIKTMETADC